jgi:hypothetical protein
LQNYGLKLHRSDRLKVIIPLGAKGLISLTAMVVGESTDDFDNQRVGLLIQEFASESDAGRYSQIVHSPSGLLYGEATNDTYSTEKTEGEAHQPWWNFLWKSHFIRTYESKAEAPVAPITLAMPIPDKRRI